MSRLLFLSVLCLALGAESRDISGTWVAKTSNPMQGETEIVYELKVDKNGKITGNQKLPFGDSPIVDGSIEGDKVTMTVELDSFGTKSMATATATIVGDELHITPAMPVRRRNGPGPGGPGPGGPPGGGPGPGPGGPGGMFGAGPLIAKRGIPTPSYRASSVDYATLPKVELPAPKNSQPKRLGENAATGLEQLE